LIEPVADESEQKQVDRAKKLVSLGSKIFGFYFGSKFLLLNISGQALA
jgi:hypothetical protein